MYKIVNGLLPEIISELCIVNNEVDYNFTKQSHLLYTRKGNKHVSIQSFSNTNLEFQTKQSYRSYPLCSI